MGVLANSIKNVIFFIFTNRCFVFTLKQESVNTFTHTKTEISKI